MPDEKIGELLRAAHHDLIHGPTGLMSETCVCGGVKNKRQSFCYRCYRALPAELKTAIWERIGEGYESAHERSAAFLKEAGRIKS